MRKRRKPRRRIKACGIDDDLEDFKKSLGPIADDYNAAELVRLRDDMHLLADILLDFYTGSAND